MQGLVHVLLFLIRLLLLWSAALLPHDHRLLRLIDVEHGHYTRVLKVLWARRIATLGLIFWNLKFIRLVIIVITANFAIIV